ncbi:translin-associated factor X-interacting protein 1 [Clonorchis sinensis]|uniref:Translin-associated factor X-interacting protein 1 n=1 Tax=Clonorchis sinensis TaxID=79923 RepID=G7YV91_CLOSI|nr:translin-associated factor X-interacting protein 1 [Clonorchis sinensis]
MGTPAYKVQIENQTILTYEYFGRNEYCAGSDGQPLGDRRLWFLGPNLYDSPCSGEGSMAASTNMDILVDWRKQLLTPIAEYSTIVAPDRQVARLLAAWGLAVLGLVASLGTSWHGCTLCSEVPAAPNCCEHETDAATLSCLCLFSRQQLPTPFCYRKCNSNPQNKATVGKLQDADKLNTVTNENRYMKHRLLCTDDFGPGRPVLCAYGERAVCPHVKADSPGWEDDERTGITARLPHVTRKWVAYVYSVVTHPGNLINNRLKNASGYLKKRVHRTIALFTALIIATNVDERIPVDTDHCNKITKVNIFHSQPTLMIRKGEGNGKLLGGLVEHLGKMGDGRVLSGTAEILHVEVTYGRFKSIYACKAVQEGYSITHAESCPAGVFGQDIVDVEYKWNSAFDAPLVKFTTANFSISSSLESFVALGINSAVLVQITWTHRRSSSIPCLIGSRPNAPPSDVNAYWDEIATTLHSAGNFACGTAPPGALKHWISDRTVALLESRRCIPAGPEHNMVRRIISRQAKFSVQADHEVWWTQKAKEMEEAQKAGNARRLFQLIRATGPQKPPVSETIKDRNEVFKEAFQLIIAAFKTHGPILAQISKEYETILQYYKNEVQKLRPAKEYLWTIKQECDQRVLELKNQEKPELEGLRREITRLKAQVSAKKEEQISMQVEIDKLKTSLEEEHGKCRHEADAKNLLVLELNDMQNHYRELQKVTQQAREEATNFGDPALLRIALDQAKKALAEAQFELTKIKADYVDVIPKREYEILMQSNQMLEEKIVEQEAKFAELTEEMKHCESELSGMIEQRDEYKRALQQLNRASTPRPQWDEVGRSLPCGLSKWNEETHGMSSQQKMQYLIRIMTKTTKDSGDGPKQLESKGVGESVPRFLRCEDPLVFRRTLQLRDCLLLTDEIWKQRKQEKETYKEPVNVRRRSVVRRRMSQGAGKTISLPKCEYIHVFRLALVTRRLYTVIANTHAATLFCPQIKTVIVTMVDAARFAPVTAVSKTSVTCWKPFDEFLENFFIQVYGIPRIRLEWAYTYYEAITNHKDYLSLQEVKRIIDNEVSSAFTTNEQFTISLTKTATGICLRGLNKLKGLSVVLLQVIHNNISDSEETEHLVVSRDQLQAVLYELTGSQFESKIENLLEKAIMVNGKDMEAQRNENRSLLDKEKLFDVKLLFFKDPGEEFNPFIRELIALYGGIKLGFVEEIVSTLEKSLDNEAEIKEVTAAQLRDAIYVAYTAARVISDAASAKRELNIIEPARQLLGRRSMGRAQQSHRSSVNTFACSDVKIQCFPLVWTHRNNCARTGGRPFKREWCEYEQMHWTRVLLLLELISSAYPVAVPGFEPRTSDMRGERVTTTPPTHVGRIWVSSVSRYLTVKS